MSLKIPHGDEPVGVCQKAQTVAPVDGDTTGGGQQQGNRPEPPRKTRQVPGLAGWGGGSFRVGRIEW